MCLRYLCCAAAEERAVNRNASSLLDSVKTDDSQNLKKRSVE